MTNEEILGPRAATPSVELTLADERAEAEQQKADAERDEFNRLQAAGADYAGHETLAHFMRRCGRF